MKLLRCLPALLFVVVSCGHRVNQDYLYGTWEIEATHVNMDYPEEEKIATESEFTGATFTFNIDGTFTHSISDRNAQGVWQYANQGLSLTTQYIGKAFTLKYSVNTLTEESMKIIRRYKSGNITFELRKKAI